MKKGKFETLVESILNSTPNGKDCLKKFFSYLFTEYAEMDDILTKKQAVGLMKKYDEDPKLIGKQMTDIFAALGFSDRGINDNEDLFGEDEDETVDYTNPDTKPTFKRAMEWAICLDTIANSTGVDMNQLGLKSYVDYVKGCELDAEEF